MTQSIDKQYANMLSSRLDRFKWVSTNKAQFRCPICKDSQKNKHKTRGSFFPSKDIDGLMVGCFNCGYSKPFGAFLKEIDTNLYGRYMIENFKNDVDHKNNE